VLDFGQPVAVLPLGIPDQDQPGAIIARLMDAMTPGSYLAITQIASHVAASEVEQGGSRPATASCPRSWPGCETCPPDLTCAS
jgi:hypothetical protein